MTKLESLSRKITSCEACPRLRAHCLKTADTKRRSYAGETYWGKPISGFGDPQAGLVIVGLAPAAHGANRTGRIFTGDRSGDWLYRALHKAGFANQPHSVHRDDGLILENAWVTCTVKCAPPGNKPNPGEIATCESFLKEELHLLEQARVCIALGRLAFTRVWKQVGHGPMPRFGHGLEFPSGRYTVLTSYHPSQQNTFTGRLTESMFDPVFRRARELLALNGS